MTSKTLFIYLTLTLSLSAVMACGDDEDAGGEEGTVHVKVYGEEFIEDGISAEMMDDDWAVQFDHFDIEINEVNVGGVDIPTSNAVDIAAASDGSGHTLASANIPVGSHGAPGFNIQSVTMAGSATKDDVTKTFELTFDNATHYTDCDTTTTVSADADATVQITIHADHLFHDSLVADSPQVLFQAIADADTDENGEVTQAELEAADIGSYDPGSEGGVDSLWAFLVAQSKTIGHIDGEGHCHTHTHDHEH